MREDIRLWQEDAHYDLDCARDMLEHSRFNYVVWLARQAVEKMLKAAYMQVTGCPNPAEHNLLELARQLLGTNIPPERQRALAFLNPHYTVTRYVDAAVGRPSELYDHAFAEESLQIATELLTWIETNFLSTCATSCG